LRLLNPLKIFNASADIRFLAHLSLSRRKSKDLAAEFICVRSGTKPALALDQTRLVADHEPVVLSRVADESPWLKQTSVARGFREKSEVTEVLIRAELEADQRHELMQMCRSWMACHPLPPACLERRVYEDALSPTHLLMVEDWSNDEAMNSYLSSGPFRALIGAIKVLGTLVDVRIAKAKVVEAG
jgi:quinol monooxygenase YgiN